MAYAVAAIKSSSISRRILIFTTDNDCQEPQRPLQNSSIAHFLISLLPCGAQSLVPTQFRPQKKNPGRVRKGQGGYVLRSAADQEVIPAHPLLSLKASSCPNHPWNSALIQARLKILVSLETAKIVGEAANLFVEGVEFEAGIGDEEGVVDAVGLDEEVGQVENGFGIPRAEG